MNDENPPQTWEDFIEIEKMYPPWGNPNKYNKKFLAKLKVEGRKYKTRLKSRASARAARGKAAKSQPPLVVIGRLPNPSQPSKSKI